MVRTLNPSGYRIRPQRATGRIFQPAELARPALLFSARLRPVTSRITLPAGNGGSTKTTNCNAMEISTTVKERSTILMALLALVSIGITILASTLQTFDAQEASEQHHLNVTSQSILLALESAIYSGSNDIRRDYLNRRTNKLFDTLKHNEDIEFVGIIDHRGGRLLTSDNHEDSITLPLYIREGLLNSGKWSGKITLRDHSVFVVGKEIFSPNNRYLLLHESPPVPLFLLVGLDMQKLDQIDEEMRESVLLQSAFILLAALSFWIVGILFLRRRKKAQRAEVLERFQATLLDNLPDGLLLFNSDLTVLAANPAATTIMGQDFPSLAGLSVAQLPEALREVIVKPEKNDPSTPQWKKVQLDGKHLELLTLTVLHSEEFPYLTIIRDRTTLHKLEHNLAQAEKLASIGTLAAGIAHEVRNPLSALRGFAQYFVKKLAGQQPEEEYAKTMVLEADRLNRVVTDLLFLSNPKALKPESINLPVFIEELLSLLQFEMKEKKVELVTDLTATTVFADRDSLKQCLLNLLLNSIDAMTGLEKRITLSSWEDETKTFLCVTDTGKGMDEPQVAQAFEPFFTDKARGTGLGLAIVNRTALDHGGFASISSSPGQGCAITLAFPQKTSGTVFPPETPR